MTSAKVRKPWTEEAKANHAASMAAKKDVPSIGCVKCKQMIRPIGWTRHYAKCARFQCKIENCIESIRGGGLGYCGMHYGINKQMRSKYGISVDFYIKMFSDQDGKCGLCGSHGFTRGRESRNPFAVLCVDHDHATGVVRGLLCHNCNVALGHFKDDEDLVRMALSYLQRHRKAANPS